MNSKRKIRKFTKNQKKFSARFVRYKISHGQKYNKSLRAKFDPDLSFPKKAVGI